MTWMNVTGGAFFLMLGYVLGWMQRRHAMPAGSPPREPDPMSAPVPCPRPKLTLVDFLGGIERELDAAADAAAVDHLLNSERIKEAKAFCKGEARTRLCDWLARAQRTHAALRAEEAARRDDAADQARDASNARRAPAPARMTS